MKKKIAIFGSGEFGSLVTNIISYNKDLKICAYGDDSKKRIGGQINGIFIFNMINFIEFAKDNEISSIVCAIGDNNARSEKYNHLKGLGFEMLSLIHPKSLIDTNVTFGENVIIEMGTSIHTHSKIGNNVFLGGDALIGHHNIIGNHVLVGGNVSFGGSVITKDFVTIGVGASIKPGIEIGEGATIGVGAAVVKNVSPGTTVVGVPAKPI